MKSIRWFGQHLLKGGELHLQSVSEADAGTYVCQVSHLTVDSNYGGGYCGVMNYKFRLYTDIIQASNGFGQPAEDQVRLHVKRMKVFIEHFNIGQSAQRASSF